MIVCVKDVKRETLPNKQYGTNQPIAVDDAYLYQALRQAERRFTDLAGFDFAPRLRTVELIDPWRQGRVLRNGERLTLPAPLLAATQVVNGANGTVDAADYRLVSLDDTGESPIGAIDLPDGVWVDDGGSAASPSPAHGATTSITRRHGYRVWTRSRTTRCWLRRRR